MSSESTGKWHTREIPVPEAAGGGTMRVPNWANIVGAAALAILGTNVCTGTFADIAKHWAGIENPVLKTETDRLQRIYEAQHAEDVADLSACTDKIRACWDHWNQHLQESHGL